MSAGRQAQMKGAAGERELAGVLQRAGYPVQWGGNKTYGEVPDLSGLPGIHVECKRVEKLNLHAAVEQATRDAQRFGDGYPTVFHRRNGEDWLVTMPLSAWIDLYKSWNPNLDLSLDTRARFFAEKCTDVVDTNTTNQNGGTHMEKEFWKFEEPMRADTGRNVLEFYPKGHALKVSKPNWTDNSGAVRPGKTVTLDLAALPNCPEAVAILRKVLESV